MRSIFTTILLWGVATIGVSLVGYYATSRMLDERRPRMPDRMDRTQALQNEGARRALEASSPMRPSPTTPESKRRSNNPSEERPDIPVAPPE